jgi:hypothetical protein
MVDTHDVVERFVDGEPVDPGELTAALADSGGREHLIDVLVLRALIGGPAALRPLLVAESRKAKGRGLLIAAGVAAVSLLGGYAVGQHRSRPPLPTPSLPATAAKPAGPAPAPTTVIRLEHGVDWREPAGSR